MNKLDYRADLNGLRALAVILVLLYHLDFSWIKGGFLGVDVFLVISGFFITRLIHFDIENKSFSFISFYKKRIKRLFPALVFTLILTLFAGYFVLNPYDYAETGKSSLWSIISVVNVFFWRESGYFDTEASFKPLLHFWSLSLEEQFYLFWPLLIFLGIRLKKNLFLLFSFVIIGSLSVAIIFNSKYPSATFFLLPFRAFEFALGALCVVFDRRNIEKKNFILFSLLGVGMILFSSYAFNGRTIMPGVYSLFPCVGTMLIILSGNSLINKALALKPIEFIGKASYSIYLIHWPLIVYYKYYTTSVLNIFEKFIFALLSILFGYLMRKFIEDPFRKYKPKNKKDLVLIWVPICIILISVFSWNIIFTNGYIKRFPVLSQLMSREELENQKTQYWRNTDSIIKFPNDTINSKKIIIMGSSHANDLAYALINNGLKANITFLPTSFRCYNFGTGLEEEFIQDCNQKKIRNLNNEAWKEADVIYLHDHWPKLDLENLKFFLNELRTITNSPIYVFGPKLTLSIPALQIIYTSKKQTSLEINEYALQYSKIEEKKKINQKLKVFLSDDYFISQKIYYIDILRVQCGKTYDKCNILSPFSGKLLYFDGGHFTEDGATEFGGKLKLFYPYLFK